MSPFSQLTLRLGDKEPLTRQAGYQRAVTLLSHRRARSVIKNLELPGTYSSAHSCHLKLWLRSSLAQLKSLAEAEIFNNGCLRGGTCRAEPKKEQKRPDATGGGEFCRCVPNPSPTGLHLDSCVGQEGKGTPPRVSHQPKDHKRRENEGVTRGACSLTGG